ncbi:MAG: carbohydrate kinase family protein [Chloroflexi bacterium HGW-Chloroflexi-1]|nr:MAG: carbohydrate kinase family protein [Chloroflexi bacterium HGW-Chloroflexi-1]
MAETPDAVVAGHICLDVIPQLSHITPDMFDAVFTPGRLTEVGPVAFSTGGAVSNTGLALHKLGIATRLMGKIGDDTFGQAVMQIIAAHGSDLTGGMVVDPAANTSYTIVINPPGLDRIFLHCPGANSGFGAEDVRYDLLTGARLFHFGYPPIMARMYGDQGAELVALFRRAKATGVTTSLDMSLPDPASPAGRAPWRKIIERTLPWLDLFVPSLEETLYMLRRETCDRLRQAASDADLLSQGHRGLYLRTAERAAIEAMGRARPSNAKAWARRELWAPCFSVEVVGATGAGDATIAGFLNGLLQDMPPEGALTAAVAVGACNVEAADALSGIHTWDETLRRVAAGWPRRELGLNAPGWRFDAARQLWIGPADQA